MTQKSKSIPNQHICTNCYFVGIGRKAGSGLLEFIGWISFILPGMAYGSWRRKRKHSVCPKCHERTMIPLDTPKGQELIQKNRPLEESASAHHANLSETSLTHAIFIEEKVDNKFKILASDTALILLAIFIILAGFGALEGQKWLAGFILFAVSPLPLLRKYLRSPFNTRKAMGIVMTCALFLAPSLSNEMNAKEDAERLLNSDVAKIEEPSGAASSGQENMDDAQQQPTQVEPSLAGQALGKCKHEIAKFLNANGAGQIPDVQNYSSGNEFVYGWPRGKFQITTAFGTMGLSASCDGTLKPFKIMSLSINGKTVIVGGKVL